MQCNDRVAYMTKDKHI